MLTILSEMKNLGLVYRVLEDATFTDMSVNYGQSYPAPHRGEEGIVVGGYDDMPVLRFADGDEVQFNLSNIERI